MKGGREVVCQVIYLGPDKHRLAKEPREATEKWGGWTSSADLQFAKTTRVILWRTDWGGIKSGCEAATSVIQMRHNGGPHGDYNCGTQKRGGIWESQSQRQNNRMDRER